MLRKIPCFSFQAMFMCELMYHLQSSLSRKNMKYFDGFPEMRNQNLFANNDNCFWLLINHIIITSRVALLHDEICYKSELENQINVEFQYVFMGSWRHSINKMYVFLCDFSLWPFCPFWFYHFIIQLENDEVKRFPPSLFSRFSLRNIT